MNHSPIARHKIVSVGTSLLLGFTALHLLWLVFGWGGETHRIVIGNLLYLFPTLCATLVVLTSAFKHKGNVRRGWLFVGLGLTAQSIGNGIWSYLEIVVKAEPFPSSADYFYLLFGPLLAVGLLQLMPPPRDRREGLRLGFDVAITVGAVGLYLWRFLLAPSFAWNQGTSVTLVSLAYPLLDLLLLSLLLLLVLRERSDELLRPEFFLFGLGVATQIAEDTLFNAAAAAGTYYIGHPMDALFSISAVLYGLAAYTSLLQRSFEVRRTFNTLNGYLVVVLPYLAVAAGFGLLLVTETDPAVHNSIEGRGVLYGTVGVTMLVVLRQLLAFNENWHLNQHLKRQSETLKQQSETLAQHSETLEARVQTCTSELEALSNRYRYDALHDALTGLPNRTHFQKQLKQVVTQERPFAVLYLDFDRFKAVNDSFGHAIGDALLVAIGVRLGECMRPGDLVARLGGDEFAVLLKGNSVTDAAQIAERLTQVFQVPIKIGNHTLYCTTSIGVVIGDGDRTSAENVLRDADIAMYRAKAAGRSQYVVFEPSMRENIQARLALETDLRGAVEREELVVYYQPVLHSASGKLAGFEALVRWQHPERGLVSPGEFIHWLRKRG